MTADDPDRVDAGRLQYSITNGNDGGHFNVSSPAGWLLVAAALDREQTESYILTVQAMDTAGNTVTTCTFKEDLGVNMVL